MPDLLLELRSEEIPARMQRKAAGDLKKLVTDGLVEAGLTYEAAREYWTPRRLTLDIRGVTARSRDVNEERKGPSVKAPDAAIQGFLRAAGLSSIAEAHVHTDPKKGDFYVAHLRKPGRAAEEIVAALIPDVIRAFPWPKSMRWGPASARPGSLRWVRPLQSILCTFGPETEEPVVVDFSVDGIRSGNVTYGHRFHAPEAIRVRRFEDYAASLERARVVLDAERRKAIILDDARNLAFASGLELVEDEALLEEVSGLVEWPVVLMGEFPEAFLAIPAEVIRLTIRANQKCFVTRPQVSLPLVGRVSAEPTGGGGAESSSTLNHPHPALPGHPPHKGDATLAPHFILTANLEATDGGAEIAHGNGKVVRARLSDALYFWNTDQADLPDLDQLKGSAEKFGLDLAKPLDQRMARLDHLGVTFHAKLGTQGERVERIRRLARELAPVVVRSRGTGSETWEFLKTSEFLDLDQAVHLADRAAVLAKADLTTEIVGEFPELQGAMGRKYAALQGEHPSVALAIEEHYRPQGPSDRVPADPVSIAVALADKLDTLVGFWAIDEKPTGSKDPFALRRAALGVIRIVVENGVRVGLFEALTAASLAYRYEPWRVEFLGAQYDNGPRTLSFDIGANSIGWAITQERELRSVDIRLTSLADARPIGQLLPDLLSFFHDRLKVYLRDKGARHDLIDAVLAGGGSGVISPRVGEMGGSPEGGAVPQGSPIATANHESRSSTLPPSALPGISPTRGEIGQSRAFTTTQGRPAVAPDGAPPRSEPRSGDSVSAKNDDLLAIVRRVDALSSFLATESGKNLLAGAKRAANILAAEEKKGTAVARHVDPALFTQPAERALHQAVNDAESKAGEAIAGEDYSAACTALSALREPVDSFFEAVLVNDENAAVRANRLALLGRIRAATGRVADFSKIAG